jgi:hypothetical protein
MHEAMSFYLSSIGTLARLTKFKYENVILLVYVLLLLGNALEAYNLGSLPFPWVTQIGLIAVVIHIILTSKLYFVPGSLELFGLFLWLYLVTISNIYLQGSDYARLMPGIATTPYPIFIGLRLLKIVTFIATIYLIFWLLKRGYKKSVIKWSVIVATLIAIVAIYIYIAQLYGFPELPRNRIGTGGRIQRIRFNYAFHRAMGTFREPSLLAEWLVTPFFLSFLYRPKSLNLNTVIISSVLLLTGSLTGILGTVLGFLGALLITNPMKFSNLKVLFRLIIILFIAMGIFSIIAVGYDKGGKNLLQVLTERVTPILFEGGMQSSNRAYIYRYISDNPIPFFGHGLGNTNIRLVQYLNINFMTSFLSLYFNCMYSGGILALILLAFFLFKPLAKVLFFKRVQGKKQFLFILAAYLSCLIMFAVLTEEFSMMFALSFALLVYEIQERKVVKCEG